jgi:effector-binding domain-containing protein
VRGAARASGKYRTRGAAEFKCAYLVHEGKGDSLAAVWAQFLTAVAAAGHEMTDERRVILQVGRDVEAGAVRLELQVGVK